ncbi:MAG: hypothetical protein H0V07_08890 [Propionibacteriales bacterium]|nr:hypothetical protein [Propionibacteriales bacterium]
MSSRNPRRSGNPATRAAAGASPRPTAVRGAVNERSRAILLRLSRLPPLVIPGLVLVLMLVGLTGPRAFAVPCLVVIAVFVGWLAYLSWPILTMRARLLRCLLVGIVVGSVVARIWGWL